MKTLLEQHQDQLADKNDELNGAKFNNDFESIPDLKDEILDILNEIRKIEYNNLLILSKTKIENEIEYNNFISNFNKTLTV